MTRRPKRPAAAGRTRAIGYVRVSLEKQAADGISLEAQRARLQQYSALYDLDLVDVVVETGSGKSLERPGLRGALDRLEIGQADALLVARLDRLTRSVADLGHLVAGPFAPGRAALLSVSEQVDTRSASGRLVLNVIASISQWEREQTSERTSLAMAHLARSGRHTGGHVVFGYRVGEGGVLVPDDDEQATIRRARELREGGASLRAIAAQLAGEGRLSRNGRPFEPSAVMRMLGRDAPGAAA